MAVLPELRVSEILGLLTARGVDFVVVGGIAAVLHGSPSLTRDLDICFADDPANLEALGLVLEELQARLRGVEEDVPFVPDARTLSQTQILTLETSAGPLDLMTRPDGAPPYDKLRGNAERMEVGGFAVLVASIEDLIVMKAAVARPKDLLAVEELETIRDLRRRGIGA